MRPDVLNTFLGSILVIILIYVEYVNSRYSSDRVQKKRFCYLLIITFIILLADFVYSLSGGISYGIHMVLNFIPVLLTVCVLLMFSRIFKVITFIAVPLLLVLFMVGVCAHTSSGDSIISVYAKPIWPFLAAFLLYTYFIIVQKETRIDNLTGFENRYSFNEFVNGLSRRKASESWLILIIDMDRTRDINNNYGHLEGDNAIRSLAAVIKNCVRKTDFVARYGGDEFALVTKSETSADVIIKDIKEELSRYNEKSRKPYKIGIICGSDIYKTGTNRQVEEFINHIDSMMHDQKQEHRRTSDEQTASRPQAAAGGTV
ncbi:MAG: GGDEF domain-containing protein [Treponema sp.]|nr:GGDEF domain-containing protein [Treponema sp.]